MGKRRGLPSHPAVKGKGEGLAHFGHVPMKEEKGADLNQRERENAWQNFLLLSERGEKRKKR